MTKYAKWKHRMSGFPNEKGHARTCMHCKRQATEKATRKQGTFSMDVWFCDDHMAVAKEIGGR